MNIVRPSLIRAASLTSSLENALLEGDILECPICYGILQDPVNGRCGHVFCNICITTTFGNHTNAPCPICRKTLEKAQLFPNLIARHFIGQCRVTCPYAISANKSGLSEESCTWHGIIDGLEEHMKTCSLRPQHVPINISPDSKFDRVPNPVISYHASSDCNGGGTGGEFVRNLGQLGEENWNKWFSGSSSSLYTITLTFAIPYKVHKYSLQSANDCIERSPKSWDLIGITADNHERVLLHSVQDDLFESHWQRKEFLCTGPSNVLFKAVELKIKNTRGGSNSTCQLGSLLLFYAEEVSPLSNNNPKPLQWSIRSPNRAGSLNLLNAIGENMFHFNPRINERQIVMNTHRLSWGHEERITLPTIRSQFSVPFEAFICNTDVGYKIYFDGKLQYLYRHRIPIAQYNNFNVDDAWTIETPSNMYTNIANSIFLESLNIGGLGREPDVEY